jgi:hypothetical protein
MMDFEYLIWFLIFLVYIGLFILKRMRSPSKSEGSGISRPGWKQKLDDFLTKAKEEMRDARRDGASMETVWDRFLPKEYDESERKPVEKPPVRTEPIKEKKPEPIIKPAPVEVAESKRTPVDSEGRVPSRGKEPARRAVDLKKAVIWAEILGPPVALK